MPNSTVDQQTKTSYSFKVNASSVEVMTFYKDKLTALGWTVVGETSAPVIAAKKNTSTIEITTFNNVPNGVSVLIIYHP